MEAKDWLNRLELSIAGDTVLRHQDSHIELETFFRDLLNLVFGWNLDNANTLFGKSQDSFDLSDKDASVAVQVTVTTTAEKIRKTLGTFVGRYETIYRRLIFVYPIIKLPESRADFGDSLKGFGFDADRDRLGFDSILKKAQGFTIDELEQLTHLLRKELKPLGAALPLDEVSAAKANAIDLIGALLIPTLVSQIVARSTAASPDSAPIGIEELSLLIAQQLGPKRDHTNSSFTVNLDPPPLPTHFVSRTANMTGLKNLSQQHPLVAVVGYAKSGKTTALAEFVRSDRTTCLWLMVPSTTQGRHRWVEMACLQLSLFLGVGSLDRREIQTGLLKRASENPITIVIDDAHLIGDLNALTFLEGAASASDGRIRVVLAGEYQSDFLEKLRSTSRIDWRIPGFDATQANEFFRLLGHVLSDYQRQALHWLVIRTDGHPNLLKLACDHILTIKDASDLQHFIVRTGSALEPGLEAFQADLVLKLRDKLRAGELELCRRITIALRPFPKRFAKAVWSVGQEDSEFPFAWDGCVLRTFEPASEGRYSLPDLYQEGLKNYSTDKEKATWHAAAAEEYSDTTVGAVSPFDIRDAVLHRLLAGDLERAIHEASLFLTLASGPGARKVQRFLLDQFEIWLANVAADARVGQEARIRWFSIRTRLQRDLGRKKEAHQSALNLRHELTAASSCEDERSRGLGWSTLLMHAAQTADVPLALEAVRNVPQIPMPDGEKDFHAWQHFCVLGTYVNAQQNPIEYLEQLFSADTETDHGLWTRHFGFDFWRSIGLTIYAAMDRELIGNRVTVNSQCDLLLILSERAHHQGYISIAVMLAAAASRIRIDLVRDFVGAVAAARRYVAHLASCDDEVSGHLHHALGDALRCKGEFVEAIKEYEKAVTLRHKSRTTERAESLVMIGICWTREGKANSGFPFFNKASRIYNDGTSKMSQRFSAQAMLEGAVAAITANRPRRALASLIRAHGSLAQEHRTSREWVAVAQVAWHLDRHGSAADPSAPCPVPGFTTGLKDIGASVTEMNPVAPTLMLARACATWDAPYRSMSYFSYVLEQTPDPHFRSLIATLALEAALKCEDLPAAIRFLLVMSSAPENGSGVARPMADAQFSDWQVSRVLRQVVAADTDSPEWTRIIESATIEANSQKDLQGSWPQLVRAIVNGLDEVLKTGNPAFFELAFELAIKCKAKRVGQTLAWFWIFRFAPGRPCQEGDFVLWQWRLCWLSGEIGRGDMPFLGQFLAQQRDFWMRVSSDLGSGAGSVLSDIELHSADYEAILAKLHNYLARQAIRFLGKRRWVAEICRCLGVIEQPVVLQQVRALVMETIGSALFLPFAREAIDLLHDILGILRNSLAAVNDPKPAIINEWISDVDGYLSIAHVVASQDTAAPITKVLLRLAQFVPTFEPRAAAHFYVMLRHSVANIDPDEDILSKILDTICAANANRLMERDVLPGLERVRFGTVAYFGQGFRATHKLTDSLGKIMLLRANSGPVHGAAARQAKRGLSRAVRAAQECVAGLESLETFCNDHDIRGNELSCLRLERGGLRKIVGMILIKGDDSEDARHSWLEPALADFCSVIEEPGVDSDGEATTMRLTAASEGLTIAKYLGNSDRITLLEQFLDAQQSTPDFSDKLVELAEERAMDPLLTPEKSNGEIGLDENDDERISAYADGVIKAYGIPSNRRKHVEGDIRKMCRFENEKKLFCRHLEPVQEALHLRSVDTAYRDQTEYTCRCSLLGHLTAIPTDDIDIAIISMKRNYCESCDKREPAG